MLFYRQLIHSDRQLASQPIPGHDTQESAWVFNFGAFRVDARAGELTKHGIRVKLQEKPFQILILLLERAGQVVTREELKQRLWGADTYVDFDRSLNIAINKLREAVCDSAETPRYVETLPRRGYRFIAPVTKNGHMASSIGNAARTRDEETTPAITPMQRSSAPANPRGKKRLLAFTAWLAAFAVAAVVALLTLIPWNRTRESSQSPRSSWQPAALPNRTTQVTLAVLPFTNVSGDTDTEYLRVALPDQIAMILSYSSGIAVRPFASTQKYLSGDVDPQAAGRQLRVTHVVTGHFLRQGDNLQVTLEAVDVETNQLLWTQTLRVSSKDPSNLDYEVSSRTRQGLIPRLSSSAIASSGASPPHNAEAYDLYLHSLAISHNVAANKQAIPMLERVVANDPNYAPAWQELGQRYYLRAHTGDGGDADLDRSDAATQRALALNPNFPDAARSLTVSRTERGDLTGAYDVAHDFLRRRPNDAQAHASMGYVLRYAGLMDESVREYETALGVDSTNFIFRSGALSILQLGNYARAHEFLRVDEGSEWAFGGHAGIFLRERKYDEAKIAYLHSAAREGPMIVAYLNHRPHAEIEAAASKAEANVLAIRDPEDRWGMADALSFCGFMKEALRMMRMAVEGNFLAFPFMDHDPLLANVRGMPEFAAIRALAIQKQNQFLAYRAQHDRKSR